MENDGDPTATVGGLKEGEALIDRDHVIRGYIWLVRCIAKSIAERLPGSVDVEDLVSAGTIGLIKAVDDFDASKGARLKTYARYRIRGAILDELRKQDLLPHSTRSKLRQLEKAADELERTLGRYPTADEIAEKVGLPPAEISVLLSKATAVDLYSLDEIFENSDGGLHLDPATRQAGSNDPLDKLERQELINVLVEAIRNLPWIERTLLALYYYDGLRMKEIGEVLGISESRVSQIHSKAILLLRGRLRNQIMK